MRDHLFHAENDEMLFRQFREESQITYNIPPIHNSKSFIKFYFPKPYSLNIQVCHFFLLFILLGRSSFIPFAFWSYGEIEFSFREMVLFK